jgi:hypothetical protein
VLFIVPVSEDDNHQVLVEEDEPKDPAVCPSKPPSWAGKEPITCCPITPFTPISITKANALRNFIIFNRLLMEVGFLNVFVVLPLVAVVKFII